MFKNFSMDTLSLLEKLVGIESPSGREEKLASFLLTYLQKLRYNAFMEGLNVLISPERDFIVASHIDTFKILSVFSFDGEYAYGTGVSDAKASIAAILLALERISPERLNFGVVFFSDEEGNGSGSKEFCRIYKPKMAVVMEPTNMAIANVQYGGLELKVEVRGRGAHGAYPEIGENAIEGCIEAMRRLKGINGAKVSVQYIRGGDPDDFVIPDKCEARIEILFKPHLTATNILSKVREILCSSNINLTVIDAYNGFISSRAPKILEDAMRSIGYRVEYTEMPSWTDAVNLHEIAGCDTAIFGPGELYACHTKWERVRIKDVNVAADILVALNNLVGEGKAY
ncbi:MAG: M20/M25/M40 family metallo-hydrolase [Candidatus Bathyarchaeia archaeon]